MSTYCFDLDGTLCSKTQNQEYDKAKPIQNMIDIVNRLYSLGDEIKIYTARGMSSGKDFQKITRLQLADWDIKYNYLIMGKPSADYYIDDKGMDPEDFIEMIEDKHEKNTFDWWRCNKDCEGRTT